LIGGDLKSADAMSAQLIQAFGSLGQVISASSAALSRVVNDPQLVSRITAVKSVAMEGLTEQLLRVQFDLENTIVQRWVIGLFNGLPTERVHLAMLDSKMRLLCQEKIVEGSFSNVSLCLRRVVSRGLDTGATSLILMHNHPSGDPRPSDADIQGTRKIRLLLENLDMRLDDHLIVAGRKIHSMMRGGTCG
jgi:DNA repair protein RadC